jgi:hypothetical protein
MDCGWGWGLWDLLDCWLKKKLEKKIKLQREEVWSSTLFNLGI